GRIARLQIADRLGVLQDLEPALDTFETGESSQISDLPGSPDSALSPTALLALASARMSKGWRRSTTSSPPFHEQFETTKSSKRRFSRASCRSNRRRADCARSNSWIPSSK